MPPHSLFVIPEIFNRESTEEDAFPSSVVFVFSVFNFLLLPFVFCFWGIIKGFNPLRKVFSSSVVFILHVFVFSVFGGDRGSFSPYSLDS